MTSPSSAQPRPDRRRGHRDLEVLHGKQPTERRPRFQPGWRPGLRQPGRFRQPGWRPGLRQPGRPATRVAARAPATRAVPATRVAARAPATRAVPATRVAARAPATRAVPATRVAARAPATRAVPATRVAARAPATRVAAKTVSQDQFLGRSPLKRAPHLTHWRATADGEIPRTTNRSASFCIRRSRRRLAGKSLRDGVDLRRQSGPCRGVEQVPRRNENSRDHTSRDLILRSKRQVASSSASRARRSFRPCRRP